MENWRSSPFFQECPFPDMTPTSLTFVLLSRSGIKLCLVLLVLTTEPLPSETNPVHHFCFLHVFLTFGNFLEIFLKKSQKKSKKVVCRGLQTPFFDFFGIFGHPRGVPRVSRKSRKMSKNVKKSCFWTPPDPPPGESQNTREKGV